PHRQPLGAFDHREGHPLGRREEVFGHAAVIVRRPGRRHRRRAGRAFGPAAGTAKPLWRSRLKSPISHIPSLAGETPWPVRPTPRPPPRPTTAGPRALA